MFDEIILRAAVFWAVRKEMESEEEQDQGGMPLGDGRDRSGRRTYLSLAQGGQQAFSLSEARDNSGFWGFSTWTWSCNMSPSCRIALFRCVLTR